MNSQMVLRVPRSHAKKFAGMVRALGVEATPAALLALLVEYADTPEGGEWLQAHYTPPAKHEPEVELPAWLNTSPIAPANK